MQNLAFLDQFGHDRRNRLGLYPRVCTVLVVQVYMVGLQPSQRPFNRTAYHLRARIGDNSVYTGRSQILKRDAEFGSYDDFVTKRLQGLTQQLLIIMWIVDRSIRFCRIKKRVTHIHRIGKQLGHVAPVCRCTVGMAHAHAPQAYGGHSQSALS